MLSEVFIKYHQRLFIVMAGHLFIFNPDCELAIANGSPYYMPPANIVRMASDLACLSVYLAGDGDYVLVNEYPEAGFIEQLEKRLGYKCKAVVWDEWQRSDMKEAEPWGWSPKICHQLEKAGLSRQWTEGRKELYSRKKAQEVLRHLAGMLPFIEQDVVPQICFSIEDVVRKTTEGRYIIKAPWSSSGRGLLMLADTPDSKQKQWLSGMFKRQGYMMLEKRLDKVFDFAMEFRSEQGKGVGFIGFSAFQTGENGEYRGNYIGDQGWIENRLCADLGKETLAKVKEQLISVLSEVLSPVYSGYMGVDMMIYRNDRNELCIQPCVEINLRYNMGIVALFISHKCLADHVRGNFSINFYPLPGEAYREHQKKLLENPFIFDNNRLRKGYLNLTPVNENTCFVAAVEVG